ncbi:DUF6443 domain-containing protein [Flavobacterium ardleyense]|uniref:DUF6443 domain-containing protein n=1 Tax=Flavobacterium ardleyense TaxID=2038737 RepID=A0ABW5Z5G3_9FLAO
MSNKLVYILFVLPFITLGQSLDQNHIKSTTYKKPTTQVNVDTANPADAVVQIGYFDGVGRPIQQIAYKQSNTGKDIVTYIEYDQFGRQIKEYLPYATTTFSLNYIDNATALSNLTDFYTDYNGGTSYPFSEKQFENSPLNRVFKQAAPGDTWKIYGGNEIKFDYQTNQASDGVKLFKAVASWNGLYKIYDVVISNPGNYAENQLYKNIIKDENWKPSNLKNNTTEEFKDKEGRVVLKRTYADMITDGVTIETAAKHDTYYIYDQYSNLSAVIPPLANGIATVPILNNLGYRYKYDYRNRLVEKKLPGKDWEFIIYDKLDRPVATGPAFTPYGGDAICWMITEYDIFGRVIQTGWKEMPVSEVDRNNNQESLNLGSNIFALAANNILTKNYYDNYTFPGAPSPTTTLTDVNLPLATNVKGMPTGSWVKVLDNPSSTTGETSYTLYDNKYRPVHSNTTNYLGGYTKVTSNLDWSGKTLYTVTKHKRTVADTELVVKDKFTYSSQDKLVLHKQRINQLPEELITKNSYDELGQLIAKNVGGLATAEPLGLQEVNYSYNVRGWLKTINNVENIDSDLFAFKINYDTPDSATPLFNGNISETLWKTSTDNKLRKYDYQYDQLNRLLKADYSKEGNTRFNSYLEQLSYDKNGNIQTLVRNGGTDADSQDVLPIDNLKYFYHPFQQNLLEKVLDKSNSPQGFNEQYDIINSDSNGLVDNTKDYTYDANGNMKTDANKGISGITYNHLDLPVQITLANGIINYLYSATGQKVRKKVTEGSTVTTTDYLSGFQYVNTNLQFFPHAEGYVNVVDGSSKIYNYVYQYKDHLGNVRVSYAATTNASQSQLTILEENHYYPFGLKHSGYNTTQYQFISPISGNNIAQLAPGETENNKYKYNGKELQDELGLNIYAMDMRQYDPAIARWIVQDPVVHFNYSPYNAFDSNPVFWADPSGADSESTQTDIFGRNRFLSNGMFIPMYERGNVADINNSSCATSSDDNVNSITHDDILNLYKNAEQNSASFYFFDETAKFAAVMNAYNLIMKFSMINEAASIVFANDSDELRKNLISINVSMKGVNKVTGDYTSFLHGNVKIDKNYNVIGTGGKDYFINYSTNTTILASKKDGFIGTNSETGKNMYDNTTTWGLGQDTFLAGHYAVSFSSKKNRGASGYDINFIGFRTNELRIRYVEYWREKIDEYVKIFQSK